VKRNRAQVIAVGIVAGALMLGLAGTTAGLIWAVNEKDRANDEKIKATLAAESELEQRKQADAARARAQEARRQPFARALAQRGIDVAAEVALGRVSASDVSRKPGA
jgi:hypothetical protein